jgi:hypothetical protein
MHRLADALGAHLAGQRLERVVSVVERSPDTSSSV